MRRVTHLRDLMPGQRFRFLAFPDQIATLVEKTPGRALIRYDRQLEPEARTFQARDKRTGAIVTKQITVRRVNEFASCALGAQVVPLAARNGHREGTR